MEKELLSLFYFQEESTNQNQSSALHFSSERLSKNFLVELYSINTSKNLELSFQVGGDLENHRGSCGGNEEVFHGIPELVDSWKKLDDLGLDEAIKRNPLHLEATKKSEDLKLHSNPIEADKLIKNINEGIDQIGDNVKIVLDKIKSGEFESIPGYKDLIQGIKKVPDDAINSNTANEVAQTFRHLDNSSSVPNSRKVLGHKSTTDPKFDIDYAEKSTGGSKLYDKACQFKTTDNASSVHNRLKSDGLRKQLLNADANEKILQVEIRNGSIVDVESGQYFTQRLQWAKDNISGFKLIITDSNGSILKMY
ncbi:hypothetical protein GCM10022393_42640 [Aquimarina addita]|uniref:tRNA nuclease CdiA C-terminal domain-containing protein n=1 Tax=Aquimarina addita TaxID=870485 RepID=A0ABP6UY89_9FLAO